MSLQDQPRQIFLGNISYDASPTDVVEALRDAGINISRVRIATHKETGAPRGFGFADLESTESRSTQSVIAIINEFEIEVRGRIIRADMAKPRPPKPEAAASDRARDEAPWRDSKRKKKGRPGGGRGKGASEFKRGRNEFDRGGGW